MAEVHLGADVSEKQPLSYASSTLEVETMCHGGQLRSANCRKASNAIANLSLVKHAIREAATEVVHTCACHNTGTPKYVHLLSPTCHVRSRPKLLYMYLQR